MLKFYLVARYRVYPILALEPRYEEIQAASHIAHIDDECVHFDCVYRMADISMNGHSNFVAHGKTGFTIESFSFLFS